MYKIELRLGTVLGTVGHVWGMCCPWVLALKGKPSQPEPIGGDV